MNMDVIFLGTGTSGNVPNIYCLTESPITCRVCSLSVQLHQDINSTVTEHDQENNDNTLSINSDSLLHIELEEDSSIPTTTHTMIPRFNKNRRRNTSIIIQYQPSKSKQSENNKDSVKNILVDCGKTFYDAALQWFTVHKLRKIDAVLLTHGHADAMFGLDDLRQWTIGGSKAVQQFVDIYCDKNTFEVVSSSFPYMVNPGKATGGGDVPKLRFHIIHPDKPFTLFDELKVHPFEVEHGSRGDGSPFMALGFTFGNRDLVYISDTNKIPEKVYNQISKPKILIIDALGEYQHPSHLSIYESVEEIQKIQPKRAYLTGLTHGIEHHELNNRLFKYELPEVDRIRVGFDGLKLSII